MCSFLRPSCTWNPCMICASCMPLLSMLPCCMHGVHHVDMLLHACTHCTDIKLTVTTRPFTLTNRYSCGCQLGHPTYTHMHWWHKGTCSLIHVWSRVHDVITHMQIMHLAIGLATNPACSATTAVHVLGQALTYPFVHEKYVTWSWCTHALMFQTRRHVMIVTREKRPMV